MSIVRQLAFVCVGMLSGASIFAAADSPDTPFDIPAHYEKSEHRVAMRDGVKLFTAVYSPKDRTRKYPVLLTRTCYSIAPYGPDKFAAARALAPSEDFLKDGYIFVLQDVRGSHESEGDFEDLRPLRSDRTSPTSTDDATDGYDTIDWIVKSVPGHTGKVGQWGQSYPGNYTVMGLLEPHPALRAASPQSPTGDGFLGDDNHQNGAFYLIGSLEWAVKTPVAVNGLHRGKPVKTWPDFFATKKYSSYEWLLDAGPTSALEAKFFEGKLMRGWEELIQHPDYDAYWQRRNNLRHLRNIEIPTLVVGSWFDGPDPWGTIWTYQAIESQSPKNQASLVMGPWSHGGQRSNDGSNVGRLQFGSKTAVEYQKNVVFPFFQYHLKGQGSWQPAKAILYETGNNRWRTFTAWPPKQVQSTPLYFNERSMLTFEQPTAEGTQAVDEYVSDPNKPVPFAQEIRMGGGADYVVADQRFLATRPDVLTYRTEPLDRDLTLAGAVPVTLEVATTGADADWIVKVIDVHPRDDSDLAGYQQLVTYSIMRAKYRNSFSHPQPLTPGEPATIRFDLQNRLHTFKKGHRLMVMVHSTWFPLFDRNPQTFTNIYTAEANAYRKATHTLFRSSVRPSHITLPLLP